MQSRNDCPTLRCQPNYRIFPIYFLVEPLTTRHHPTRSPGLSHLVNDPTRTQNSLGTCKYENSNDYCHARPFRSVFRVARIVRHTDGDEPLEDTYFSDTCSPSLSQLVITTSGLRLSQQPHPHTNTEQHRQRPQGETKSQTTPLLLVVWYINYPSLTVLQEEYVLCQSLLRFV